MELGEYWRVLRAYWAGMLIMLLASVGAAVFWSVVQPRVYTADASGFVATPGATDLGSSMVGDQLARAKVRSYLDIGTWRVVAEFAIAELGLTASPEQLVNQVTVTNPADTVILQVKASASSPEKARDLAGSWLRGIIAQVEQIEAASGGPAAVTVVPGDSARLPSEPSSPNVRMNLALGGLIGALLGLGYAMVRDRMDQHIRTPEGVEAATGLSAVGTLPFADGLKDSSVLPHEASDARRPEWTALAEAFRGLRTNLQYMSIDDPPRAIVVSSPLPGDGKSFTAANLATTIAAAGQRVVLVDSDLRRPRLAAMFGLPEGAGLSDVLAGRVEVRDVLQPADPSGNLQVLAAGAIPPNPSEILGSQRMRHLIAELSADALVIIDSPPLLPVTDAAVLSTRADGALVVVSAGKTTYDVLDGALSALEKAKGKALGIVLNQMPTSGVGSSYYGYHYTADYYRNGVGRRVASAGEGSGSRGADSE